VFDFVDDEWVSMQKLCGRDLPASINSTGSQMRVLFHSNAGGSNNGFKVITFSISHPFQYHFLQFSVFFTDSGVLNIYNLGIN
jgi:hypothetical protein